jgi:hypothetical protein
MLISAPKNTPLHFENVPVFMSAKPGHGQELTKIVKKRHLKLLQMILS